MKTKYGDMHDNFWINYFNDLVGKIFKILPLKEENVSTLHLYIQSLLRELIGNKKLAESIGYNPNFISLCGVLNNLINEKDLDIVRSDVFKCISLVKKIQSSIQRSDDS